MIESARSTKFVFIGNRRFVLDEMLSLNLNISNIYAYAGSHLEKQLTEENINFTTFSSKTELITHLSEDYFDVLVSNGCPFILPLSVYVNPSPILVNIHPSYLPQLAGKDPIPGAILNNLNSGATCHQIDTGIDTGPIISQIEISDVESLDIGLLYQLSFLAEVEVFRQAYSRNFVAQYSQPKMSEAIYYSRSPEDQLIDFEVDSNSLILSKVRAFGNPSQGVKFIYKDQLYKVFDARLINNKSVIDYADNFPNGTILFSYDNKIVIKKDGEILQLSGILNAKSIIPNTRLFNVKN